MISSSNIAKAVLALTDKHPHNAEKIADDLLKFVQKYHLETQLSTILADIETEMAVRAKKVTFLVQSPYALDHATLTHIKKFADVPEHAKTETAENRALIGGFLAYWQDKKIDGSIAHSLDVLQDALVADTNNY